MFESYWSGSQPVHQATRGWGLIRLILLAAVIAVAALAGAKARRLIARSGQNREPGPGCCAC